MPPILSFGISAAHLRDARQPSPCSDIMSGASMLSGPLCSVAAITLLAATAASAGEPVGAVAQLTADGPSAASTWMPIVSGNLRCF